MKRAISVLIVAAAALAARADAGPDAAALFKSKCALCYGPDGKGKTPIGKSMKVRDLTSAAVQKQSNASLFKIIAEGKGKMPPFRVALVKP